MKIRYLNDSSARIFLKGLHVCVAARVARQEASFGKLVITRLNEPCLASSFDQPKAADLREHG
jgi:hypothetical protein